MSTLSDLFNPGGIQEEKPKETEVYSVSYKKGKNNVYKSVIRFLPWYQNPSKNVFDKYVTYLKNPINKQIGRYIDNPREDSPVSNMYWRLVNTGDPRFVDFAKEIFASKRQYAALVQIIQDEQRPELVGQVKVFKFGKSIMDKLKAEEKPVVGQGINPFHPIYGRHFVLVCTEKHNFPNYDQSCFYSPQYSPGMLVPNATTGALEPATEQTDQQSIMNFLQTYSPDLTKYDVQPWSEADQKFVSEVLTTCENYIMGGAIAESSQVATQQSFAVLSGSPVQQPVFPGAVGAPSTQQVVPQVPVQQPVFPGASPVVPPTAAVPPVPQPTVSAPVPQFGAPMGTPVAPPAPQPVSMGMPPVGQPMVQGVEIPSVTPQGAPAGTPEPGRGMNVDDILAQL